MRGEGDGAVVDLAERRLIARLRRGEPGALAELWGRWGPAAWSVCAAMAGGPGDEAAKRLLLRVYEALPREAAGWTPDRPLSCRIAGLVYRVVVDGLELRARTGIEAAVPTRFAAPAVPEIAGRIAALEPYLRLVYLLDVFFDCPAAALAELAGVAEPDIRAARAAAAWALVARAE